jgi:hypothetical protein
VTPGDAHPIVIAPSTGAISTENSEIAGECGDFAAETSKSSTARRRDSGLSPSHRAVASMND